MGNNTDMEKRVYLFKEGTIGQKSLLGNKGANLCEMTRLGLPVPPGFVITTQVCREYFNNGHQLPPKLKDDVMRAIKQVEKELGTGATFGDPLKPLLFSVRSGAAVSMPGMMDTVLNLGMNDEVVAGLIKRTSNRRWAYDCYRRFIQMFCNVVLGQSLEPFEAVLTRIKTAKGVKHENELSAEDMEAIAKEFVSMAGNDVPTDPQAQLQMAIHAVLKSWYTPRAVRYRLYNNIPEDMGTAVNVQAMVFGNMGPGSGTGVAFTRNPATGEAVFYGEYLEDAEGEDVVSGVRTPVSLAFLQQTYPKVYAQLDDIQRSLERHYRDMQDIEFTVQEGRLYILQTRTGKRTAKASVEIAVDMVTEGLITEPEALLRVEPQRMNYFLHPSIDPNAEKVVLAKGLPASPGAATGVVVFCPDDAENAVANGQTNVILVRCETTADDIHGMRAAVGILTERGGMTSHAAVVARGMGKCCVVGCHDIHVDYDRQQFTTANGQVVRAGEVITLDGVRGEVALGDVPRTAPGSDATFHKVLEWARKYTKLRVCANADTPKDAEVAMSFGADGIGLCRTEHMFFDPDRIDVMRVMILSDSVGEREKYLEKLYGFQKMDMAAMFHAMRGRPVTIRLLDPPLHEFLPQSRTDIEALASRLGRDADALERAIEAHHEMNPMLGFRGCRLSIKYPEITLMQVRAIVSAAMEVARGGVRVTPEIMVPLPCTANELKHILPQIRQHIQEVMDSEGNGAGVDVRVGTMMEVPRACLTAHEIAPLVDFMSFGTNDLTQMTFGFSRDDVSTFLPVYLEKKVLPCDPFTTIDPDGVGQLVKMTVEKTRAIDPKIELGVCGEHGGDPASIRFFHTAGLDYVSCSPYRVPIAIIAAAQAAVLEDKAKTSRE